MIITALTIENFKGVQEPVLIEFKPITLLFGPNSAGKSTIIQALHYAREIFVNHNLNPDRTELGGDAIDLGAFDNFVNNHDKAKPIRLRFDIDYDDVDIPEYFLPKFHDDDEDMMDEFISFFGIPDTSWVEILIQWSDDLKKPLIRSYEVGFNKELFARLECSENGEQVGIVYLNLASSFLGEEADDTSPNDRHQDSIQFYWKEELLSSYVEPFISKENRWAVTDPEKFIEHRFDQLPNTTTEEVKELVQSIKDNNINPYHMARNWAGYGIKLQNQEDAFPFNQINNVPFGQFGIDPETQNTEPHPDPYVYRAEADFYFGVLTNLISGPGKIIQDELKRMNYLATNRKLPPRYYQPSRLVDSRDWASGMAAWDILYGAKEEFTEKVNDWLISDQKLDCGYKVVKKPYIEMSPDAFDFLLEEGKPESGEANLVWGDDVERIIEDFKKQPVKTQLYLEDASSRLLLRPPDVGVGISQVIPIVVLALHTKGGFALIEEPESNTHPKLQVRLADLFVSSIVRKWGSVCYLIETHSEHFILRLLRRIRETHETGPSVNPTEEAWPPELLPDQVSVNFIQSSPEGLKLTHLRIDETGEFIDRWPEGFFEERGKELFD